MITIRETVDGDLPALAALRATWAAEQAPAADGTTVDPQQFVAVLKNWLEANPRIFFLAEDDGVPVGMLNLMVFERMPKPGKAAGRGRPGVFAGDQRGTHAPVPVVGVPKLLRSAGVCAGGGTERADLLSCVFTRTGPAYEPPSTSRRARV